MSVLGPSVGLIRTATTTPECVAGSRDRWLLVLLPASDLSSCPVGLRAEGEAERPRCFDPLAFFAAASTILLAGLTRSWSDRTNSKVIRSLGVNHSDTYGHQIIPHGSQSLNHHSLK